MHIGYRIVVLASAVGPVIEAAGGFLCDRARSGWEVSVLLAAPGDARALAILGVSGHGVHDSSVDVASVIRVVPKGTAVLVGADLLDDDVQARDELARAAVGGHGAVCVWGRPAPAEIGNGLAPVRHELSPAAIAFKSQALRAAGDPRSAEPVESLYRVCGRSYRRLYSV